MNKKHLVAGAVVVCALLLMAAPAAFAGSAADGYSEPAGTVQQQLGNERNQADSHAAPVNPRTAAADDGGPRLPFTGIDVGLVLAAGLLLLALGFTGRRLGDSVTR